ncbi:hypothetical protein [Pseudomonas sp. EA_5y_Pfl2_R50]|uniref:hypothetical protein n=1 Tax=Pseudomonas sp. EA_5y_Pfl2_R50 TaxID=3088691 RepID=UPI0030D6E542
MTFKKYILALLVGVIAVTAYAVNLNRSMDVLSVYVGKPYEQVVEDSTFAVDSKTAIYPGPPPHPSSTWISDPVVVQFDDPSHGFTLPPTKFGAVTYRKSKVATVTTSPMLETIPFAELVPLLEKLQLMLKAAGWAPRDVDKHAWVEVPSDVEKSALQRKLFDQVVIVLLQIPYKYTLALNVKCYVRCDERDPDTARYLIDVSIGSDNYNR